MNLHKKYLYNFHIMEVDRLGTEMSIANYLSNAAPPQIGSTIDPGEFNFNNEGGQEYRVIKVCCTPHKDADIIEDDVSNTSYIRVVVEKAKRDHDQE